jgi:integrase
MALYLWPAGITGARRGKLCAMQVRDLDLDNSVLHLAFNYIVVDGRRVRKDTKTHQDRYLAIGPVTCTMLREHLEAIRAGLRSVRAISGPLACGVQRIDSPASSSPRFGLPAVDMRLDRTGDRLEPDAGRSSPPARCRGPSWP